jgi:hypothetical protein
MRKLGVDRFAGLRGSAEFATRSVAPGPRRSSALSASHSKSGFAWGFCMHAQGA